MKVLPLYDNEHQCGYFAERKACYEEYVLKDLDLSQEQLLLDWGFRSFGPVYFRPKCSSCKACVPLRVPIASFEPSRSQRRVQKKAAHINVLVQTPQYGAEKFEIYKDHSLRFGRGEQSLENFRISFYYPNQNMREILYYDGLDLIAFGLVKESAQGLSSVYFCYRQRYARLSLGVYSALYEIEYAKSLGKKYLYLGYYIAQNHFMSYKGQFCPNEILGADGQWKPFAGGDACFESFPTPLSKLRLHAQ